MLMIQGKQIQIVNREIKKGDQLKVVHDEIEYIGTIHLITVCERKTIYMMNTMKESIHITLGLDSEGYNETYLEIFKSDAVIKTYSYDAYRMVNPATSYGIDAMSETLPRLMRTEEKKSVNAERPLTIEDELKYVNDGCTYKILYISPEDNMIIQNMKTNEERVVNKKDRQLQIALGIRKA